MKWIAKQASRGSRTHSAVVVVLSVALVTILAMLVPLFVEHSYADTVVTIADLYPDTSDGLPPGTRTRFVYHTQTTNFTYAGGYVILSNCSDTICGITTDDAIRIIVTRPDNTTVAVEFDFYAITFPVADLTSLFRVGTNTVTTELIDLMGPQYGSSHPFNLISTTTAPPPNALIVEAPPPGTQYSYPWIFGLTTPDPVHTLTGSYAYMFTDFSIVGRGPSPVFTRAYNSNDTRVGPLGPGWTHSYNMHLASPSVGSTDVVLVGPQGRSDLYTDNGDDTYTPPTGVQTMLVRNGDGTYTATQKDLTKWEFSATGKIIRIEDRYGNISLLDYNGDGRLVTIGDPAVRGTLHLSYDAVGRLVGVSDWMSPARTVHYEYDGQGRLWHVLDRENKQTTFEYDGTSQRLLRIIDANGNIAVTNTYDGQGRVVTQKDARGLITGQQTTFQYNDNGDGTKTTIVTYPTTSVDPSWHPIDEDTYDPQGRIIRHVTKPSADPAEWVTQTHTWDANSNRTSTTDGRGETTLYCYDVNFSGATIPGSHGNLTRQIEPAAEPGVDRAITLFAYDVKNNLVQTIAPKGVSGGPSPSCSVNLSGSLNMKYAINMVYDGATRTKLLSVTKRYTDPELGDQTATTKYEYGDAVNAGKVTKIISPRGNTGPSPDYGYATTLDYFTSGSKLGMLQRETDANGNVTTHDYDVVGRQISMVDPNGNAPGGVPAQHTWTYTYDNEDRVRFTSAPAPTAGGQPLITESRYDDVGNRIVSIDANGQVVRFIYDERDSLKETWESPNTWTDPSLLPSGLIRTEYQYDTRGNMSRVTRAKADAIYERATDYAYDGLNRLRRESQYPNWPSTVSALVTTYNYDKNSNRTGLTDALNRTTTSGFDARNLLRAIQYSDGVTPNVAYTYDLNGNRRSMVDGNGTTLYSVDEMDRMISVSQPTQVGPQVIGYRYDLDGNRTMLIYPSGLAVSYTFDQGGRLQSLTDSANRTVGYGYFPDGNLQTIANPNGTTAEYSYDNAQRLTQVWNKEGTNTISKHNYTLDSVSNRTRVEEVLPENGVPRPDDPSRRATTLYGYDQLYRLTSERNTFVGATYSYDPVGNRILMVRGRNNLSYSYDRADRMTQMGGVSVTVDAMGNMVARGKESYVYDQANRLIQSRNPQPAIYYYDGDGKRVKSNIDQGPLDPHVYDVNRSLPVLLFDGRRTYIWGLGLSYALDGNGTMEVYHTDGLGSVRAVTYPNGNVVQNYLTDAFGVSIKRQGTSNQPFQYAGEEKDKETGFIYLRARYYDPTMGRFVQKDHFAGRSVKPQSLNRFVYVENNPVSAVDPAGLASSRVLVAGWRGSPWAVLDVHVPIRTWLFWRPTWNSDILIFTTGFIGLQGNNAITTNPDGTIRIGPFQLNYYKRTLGLETGPVSATTEPGVTLEAKGPIPYTSYSLTGGVTINSIEVPRGRWLGAVADVAEDTLKQVQPFLPLFLTIGAFALVFR